MERMPFCSSALIFCHLTFPSTVRFPSASMLTPRASGRVFHHTSPFPTFSVVLDGSMFLHREWKPGQQLRNGLLLAGTDFGLGVLFLLVFTLRAALFSILVDGRNSVLGVQGLRTKAERLKSSGTRGWKSLGLQSGFTESKVAMTSSPRRAPPHPAADFRSASLLGTGFLTAWRHKSL